MHEQNKATGLKAGALALLAAATLFAWPMLTSAQQGGGGPDGFPAGGPPGPSGAPAAGGGPVTGRARAPFDLSGYWVALVTQNWRYRMVVPGPGHYSGIPISKSAKQYADSWNESAATAGGKECDAYGAPAVMMLPTRLHITWQDDNTLRVETDAGTQTRLLHFDDSAPGAASLQGYSKAQWLIPAAAFGLPGDPPGGPGAGTPAGPTYGLLRVATTNLLAGLLRKNGVPYSDKTTMQEDWILNSMPGGTDYLSITSLVKDPVYLRGDYYFTPVFVRESDASKWQPTKCSLKSAR